MNTQPKLEQPVRGLLSVPKGTLTVGQLMGSWPGNETDEEIAEVLARLRNWDLTLNEEESIMSEAQEPKPQKINRLDPLWSFTSISAVPFSEGHIEDRAKLVRRLRRRHAPRAGPTR